MGNLKRHMLVHTRKKNFQCSECGKAFALNAILKKHMAVHTGERSFECKECHKSFTRSSCVLCHLKSLKPFKYFCGK